VSLEPFALSSLPSTLRPPPSAICHLLFAIFLPLPSPLCATSRTCAKQPLLPPAAPLPCPDVHPPQQPPTPHPPPDRRHQRLPRIRRSPPNRRHERRLLTRRIPRRARASKRPDPPRRRRSCQRAPNPRITHRRRPRCNRNPPHHRHGPRPRHNRAPTRGNRHLPRRLPIHLTNPPPQPPPRLPRPHWWSRHLACFLPRPDGGGVRRVFESDGGGPRARRKCTAFSIPRPRNSERRVRESPPSPACGGRAGVGV
jgi:hypothetical protein